MRTSLSILAALLLAGFAPAQGKVDFDKQILPIFKARCFECHAGEEDEGDLLLDSKASVFDASRDELVVKKGDPEKSTLYQRLVLDADDPDIMPADGDPLTKKEIALIKRWIEEGAPWGKHVAKKAAPKTKTLRFAELDAPAKARAAAAVARVRKLGGTAMPIANGTNAMYVNLSLLTSKVGDAQVDLLGGLEPVLAWLNLGRTKVGDEGAKKLAAFKQLRELHLERSQVGDAGVSALAGLAHLEYLNLYGTKVGDASIDTLAKLPALKKLFLWGSKVSDAGAARLRKARPQLKVERGEGVKAIQEVTARIEAMRPVNDFCPLMPKRRVDASKVAVVGGERIGFCCAKCLANFKKDPTKHLAKVKRRKGVKKPVGAKAPSVAPGGEVAVAALANEFCVFNPKKKALADHATVFEGKRIGFCCAKCLAGFKKNPKKHAAKVAAAIARSSKQAKAGAAKTTAVVALANEACPLRPKSKAKAKFSATFQGKRIGFCCARCLAAFESSPDKFAAKIDAVVLPDDAKRTPEAQKRRQGRRQAQRRANNRKRRNAQRNKMPLANEMCLLMPKKKVKPRFSVVHAGKRIGFCCRRCLNTFKKNPKRFADKIAKLK